MHLARVGFSKLHTDVGKLGEEPDSWGYGSTGRRSLNGRYESYGQSFGVGDEITCFLDLSSERARISFAKNSMPLGTAFNFTRPADRGGALFPHVLLKNVSVRVDFDGAVYGEQGVTGASLDGYLPWKVSSGDGSSDAIAPPHEEQISTVRRPTCGCYHPSCCCKETFVPTVRYGGLCLRFSRCKVVRFGFMLSAQLGP